VLFQPQVQIEDQVLKERGVNYIGTDPELNSIMTPKEQYDEKRFDFGKHPRLYPSAVDLQLEALTQEARNQDPFEINMSRNSMNSVGS
jgi:hypothetical protein